MFEQAVIRSITVVCGLILLTATPAFALVAAVWDGGGATNNWSEAANWVNDILPGPGNDVKFDGTSSKNGVIDASFVGTVRTLTIDSAYAGVISANRSLLVTEIFEMANGTVMMNNFDLAVGADFTMTGGSFIAPTGTMTVGRDFVRTGSGIFVHNSGTLELRDSGVLNAGGGNIAFNKLRFNIPSDYAGSPPIRKFYPGNYHVVDDWDVYDLSSGGMTFHIDRFSAALVTIAVDGNLYFNNSLGAAIIEFGSSSPPDNLTIELGGMVYDLGGGQVQIFAIINGGQPTATPTVTPTSTTTATPTATSTPTVTATPTGAPIEPTNTPNPTATPPVSPTNTIAPTPTTIAAATATTAPVPSPTSTPGFEATAIPPTGLVLGLPNGFAPPSSPPPGVNLTDLKVNKVPTADLVIANKVNADGTGDLLLSVRSIGALVAAAKTKPKTNKPKPKTIETILVFEFTVYKRTGAITRFRVNERDGTVVHTRAAVKPVTSKKKDVVNKTQTRNNSTTVRKLPPGTYAATYKALYTQGGKKVIASTKESAQELFTLSSTGGSGRRLKLRRYVSKQLHER